MPSYQLKPPNQQGNDHPIAEEIRQRISVYAKDFKTSWVHLGQALYTVWQDKLFYVWGYDKFDYYVEQEVGLPKQLALKLLKTYGFLEENEPEYLKKEFAENRDPLQVPGYEAVNALRLARRNKEIEFDDYQRLKKAVFEKGKDAAVVRKDLAALIRERKHVDPETERERRSHESLKRLLSSLRLFEKDMETLKLVPANIIQEAKGLIKKLEDQMA